MSNREDFICDHKCFISQADFEKLMNGKKSFISFNEKPPDFRPKTLWQYLAAMWFPFKRSHRVTLPIYNTRRGWFKTRQRISVKILAVDDMEEVMSRGEHV